MVLTFPVIPFFFIANTLLVQSLYADNVLQYFVQSHCSPPDLLFFERSVSLLNVAPRAKAQGEGHKDMSADCTN